LRVGFYLLFEILSSASSIRRKTGASRCTSCFLDSVFWIDALVTERRGVALRTLPPPLFVECLGLFDPVEVYPVKFASTVFNSFFPVFGAKNCFPFSRPDTALTVEWVASFSPPFWLFPHQPVVPLPPHRNNPPPSPPTPPLQFTFFHLNLSRCSQLFLHTPHLFLPPPPPPLSLFPGFVCFPPPPSG